MTTGESILVILFVLAGTIGPWVWIVYGLVQASNETFEPGYQPRTYRTSAWYFFFSVDFLMAFFLIAFGSFLTHFLSKPISNKSDYPDWTVFTLIGLLIVMSFGIAFFILKLYLNYWKYTKDRILAFDPTTRILTVHADSTEYEISEENIRRVDVFSNENHKFLYSYFHFTFGDGRELVITDKTKGAYAIFEFFKNLPTHRHKRWLPIIQQLTSE